MDPDRTASLMTPSTLAQAGRPKAVVSSAAWLDQMAADAGHLHLHRLAELRGVLETHAQARDPKALGSALEQLEEALPQLDFSLLESRGWWARTTGKSRNAGAEFSACVDQMAEAVKAVQERAQELQKKQQAEAAATERALVEFDVECRAIDKIIDQGGRWLQDMRNQLQARHAQAADAQSVQQIKDDAARCEILVGRLKLLRTAATAAQETHREAHATAAARAALVQLLQHSLAAETRAWQARLPALAAQALDAQGRPPGLAQATETHSALQLCVKQAGSEAAQLLVQEQALSASLAAMAGHIEAAG